ncbi:t-SNARE [Blastocladiella britannica]|nr:t-SNARE [Blastocladiella britannica]
MSSRYNTVPAGGNTGTAPHTAIELSQTTLLPSPSANSTAFYDQISALDQTIESVRDALADLQALHARALEPRGADEAARNAARLLQQHDDIRSELDGLKNELARAESLAGTTCKSESDRSSARNLLNRAATRVRDLVAAFRDADARHQAASRAHLARQIRIARPDLTNADIDELISAPGSSQQQQLLQRVFADSVIHSGRVAGAQVALRDAERRQTELEAIARQVEEVAALFNDMSVLIDEQDARIDSIFANADAIARDLDKAKDEMGTAVQHRKLAIKNSWILLGICLALVLVIVLYVLLGTSWGKDLISGSKSSSSTTTTVVVTATPTPTATKASILATSTPTPTSA